MSSVPSVDVHEAKARLDVADSASSETAGPLVVDVRNPDEFAQARLTDSVLMPLPVFAARCGELPSDRPLLILCASGNRSAMATGHLLALGYPDVANIEGGIVAWYRAGLPIRTGPVEPGEGDLPG